MRNNGRITLMMVAAGGLLVGCVSCGLIDSALPAKSTTQFALAKQDPSVSSTFTLDFGEYGGESTAQITRTDFLLEFDPVEGSARLASYYQTVDPIELPGGISTGEITVVIQSSNGGTFDSETGAFAIDDVYAVYFDGDLSAFGIESPFVMPGISAGTLSFDGNSRDAGRVGMEWSGTGTLAQLPFSYRCRVKGVFDDPQKDDALGDDTAIPN